LSRRQRRLLFVAAALSLLPRFGVLGNYAGSLAASPLDLGARPGDAGTV